MGNQPHVIVIPLPALGHVAPRMKLAYNLAYHGIKVTYVNTDYTRNKIISAIPQKILNQIPIVLVSVPDGFVSSNDHGPDSWKNIENASKFLRVYVLSLIKKLLNNNEKGTHLIFDIANGWALEVSKEMSINTIAFVPYGVGNLSIVLHAPKLVEAGSIDCYGIPIKEDPISLSDEIPAWEANELLWSIPGNPEEQKFVFRYFIKNIVDYVRISDSIIVKSFYELEQSACHPIPDAIPIGSLFINPNLGPFIGNFWAEDSSCLNWLDQQPPGSVIYAAFGSSVTCNQKQLNELAIGLEMTGKSFLWVVRSDFTNEVIPEYPEGFIKRTENYGKIVKWAPQENVLAHPSIACFFSHCGWNSTLEGVSMGVPFLYWPYVVDQFHNRDYISKGWKVGLRVIPNEDGIVTGFEIKSKIEKLLSDDNIKANSLKLKELAGKSVCEGGSSHKNFIRLVEHIKQ